MREQETGGGRSATALRHSLTVPTEVRQSDIPTLPTFPTLPTVSDTVYAPCLSDGSVRQSDMLRHWSDTDPTVRQSDSPTVVRQVSDILPTVSDSSDISDSQGSVARLRLVACLFIYLRGI
jgi:hypothetical protein